MLHRSGYWIFAALLGFLCVSAQAEDTVRPPDPLFAAHDTLDVRIEAPLATILSERSLEDELPGKFVLTDEAGTQQEFDIQIRARGNFRRRRNICAFPPLRLNFKKSQTKDTLLHKQDKLKLVTHCRSKSKRYEQGVVREFAIYRILNLLTEFSYQVRPLRVTYIDTEGEREELTAYAFLIEHRDRLAKRIGQPYLEIHRTEPRLLQPQHANIVSVFHFLIGNTDFSAVAASEGEICCHNHVLFGAAEGPIWSVPYDFDMSGFVNLPHSAPSPNFQLRSAKQRLYRGRCTNNDELQGTIAAFQQRRADIFAMIDGLAELAPDTRKTVVKYIESFYKVLDSPANVERQLYKRCI